MPVINDLAQTQFALESRGGSGTNETVSKALTAQQKGSAQPKPRLSLSDRFKVIAQPAPSRHVIVLGAGLAGLSAAYELETLGYSVTVIEARRDVGGRVQSRSDVVKGKIMEAGAELIGLKHLAWWSYKDKFGLTLNELPDSGGLPPIILGGRRLEPKEAADLAKQMDRAQRLISRVARPINADEPWKSPNASRLDRMSLTTGLGSIEMSDECRLAFLEQLQADNGVQAAQQSWLGNLAMIKGGGLAKYWTETETHHCEGGNQKLAFKFKGRLRKILLGRAARAITIDAKGVTVFTTRGKPLTGSDVIVAIPPTKWRGIAFSPILPKPYNVQFGQNVKYLMNVQSDCWKPDGPDMSSDGPIDLTWEGTAEGGPRAGLVAFSGANDAAECRSWHARKSMYLRTLATVYPNISESCQKGLFMDWPGKKWTLGSYSFPKPGEVTRVGPLLRSGFKGRVHFAGEHTCYAFVGYMEGALRSGLRVAEQIARRDRVIS
jgi:monoamine oxidase